MGRLPLAGGCAPCVRTALTDGAIRLGRMVLPSYSRSGAASLAGPVRRRAAGIRKAWMDGVFLRRLRIGLRGRTTRLVHIDPWTLIAEEECFRRLRATPLRKNRKTPEPFAFGSGTPDSFSTSVAPPGPDESAVARHQSSCHSDSWGSH